ncbi:MAG TPA: exosortase/archaeosortase family protein [Candidatus Deferrimicrobiaceae bacterium]|nr:exosortase/archaeosortase family protein [Candidatus Deferrimicrobiaceae bacterium]
MTGTIEKSPYQKKLNPQGILLKAMPLIALIIPLLFLLILNPADMYLGSMSPQASFEAMWKGRTFQLFFIWLIALEFILDWEVLKLRINLQNKTRTILYAAVLTLPTLYVLFEAYFGLNSAITNWAMRGNIAFAAWMPLSFEYIAFSVFLVLAVGVSFGKKGITGFALPALFAAMVGILYAIDNMFPYGEFTPFQLLVPTTTSLAAGVLGLMGNSVVMGTEISTGMPTLDVAGPLGQVKFAVAWPCAGIESLLIFTAVSLLFLNRMKLSWKAKFGFFALGAVITYFINVLRITTIFTLGMQFGATSTQVQDFHFIYGPLCAMAWIVSYPLIILAVESVCRRTRKPQQAPLNPV